MSGACNSTLFLAPPPGAQGRGQNVKYYISITKSISKIFITNFVCLLTNKSYKTYQTGLSFRRLGDAPRLGLGGTVGGGGGGGLRGSNFFLNSKQIWCVTYLHEWYMQQHNFLVPAPLGQETLSIHDSINIPKIEFIS